MSIDLKLPTTEESVTVKFKLPKDVASAFQLYVQAAQEQNPSADDSLVLATLVRHHIKKDRAFRNWLKSNTEKTNNEKQQPFPKTNVTGYEQSREVA